MKSVLMVATAVVLFSTGCAGGASRREQNASSTPAGTTMALVEAEAEECGAGAQCAPDLNPTSVPDVVGMEAERACRVLLREELLGYVYGKRQGGAEPGRVVAQKPEAGTKLDYPQGVFLFVSKPFPDRLPENTRCAERKVGPLDQAGRSYANADSKKFARRG